MTLDAGRLDGSVHVFPLRVYYEDTDALGMVYYANYLKYAERARTEMLRFLGVDQLELRRSAGASFVVRRAEIDYRHPARMNDALEIRSRIVDLAGASLAARQSVHRDGEPLVEMTVKIACVGADGRPLRLPAPVRAALSALNPPPAPRSRTST